MSLISASDTLRIAKQVKLEKRMKLQQEIDADIQNLIAKTNHIIKDQEPDKKGYYSYKVYRDEIKYDDWETVFNQYVEAMHSQGFIMTIDVHGSKNFFKKSIYCVIKFRPNPDD